MVPTSPKYADQNVVFEARGKTRRQDAQVPSSEGERQIVLHGCGQRPLGRADHGIARVVDRQDGDDPWRAVPSRRRLGRDRAFKFVVLRVQKGRTESD